MKSLLIKASFISLLSLTLIPSGVQAYGITAVGKKFAKRAMVGLITGGVFYSTEVTLGCLGLQNFVTAALLPLAITSAINILTKETNTNFGIMLGIQIALVVAIKRELFTEDELIKPLLTATVIGGVMGEPILKPILKKIDNYFKKSR